MSNMCETYTDKNRFIRSGPCTCDRRVKTKRRESYTRAHQSRRCLITKRVNYIAAVCRIEMQDGRKPRCNNSPHRRSTNNQNKEKKSPSFLGFESTISGRKIVILFASVFVFVFLLFTYIYINIVLSSLQWSQQTSAGD